MQVEDWGVKYIWQQSSTRKNMFIFVAIQGIDKTIDGAGCGQEDHCPRCHPPGPIFQE